MFPKIQLSDKVTSYDMHEDAGLKKKIYKTLSVKYQRLVVPKK